MDFAKHRKSQSPIKFTSPTTGRSGENQAQTLFYFAQRKSRQSVGQMKNESGRSYADAEKLEKFAGSAEKFSGTVEDVLIVEQGDTEFDRRLILSIEGLI
jgi:hypothetical protein